MSALRLLAKGVKGAVTNTFDMATGNVAQRALFGATAAGGYSFATSDANNFTNRLEDAGSAAALGGIAGAATTKALPFAQGVGKNMWGIAKQTPKSAMFIANNARSIFGTTAVVGGGLLAANAAATTRSPTLNGNAMEANLDQQAAQNQMLADQFSGGIAPQGTVMPMRRYKELQNSTAGLVQGMHARRHS